MKYTLSELRNKPQINFQVPYSWMSKLTNEEIAEWEAEAIQEAEASIAADVRARPANVDPAQHHQEVVNKVNSRARIIEREYTHWVMI